MSGVLQALIALMGVAEPVFSGPQPGEKLTPFKVLAALGPAAGKEIGLPGAAKEGPVVLVFVHELTEPVVELLKPIDDYGVLMSQQGLATHLVWLTRDKNKAEAFLLTYAKKARGNPAREFHSPVSISLDGLEGPGNYGLNRQMTLTILVAKDNQVTANFALIQPNETDAPHVLRAVAKVLGKPAGSVDDFLANRAKKR